jgi:PAS domain S-box-containing protein
LEKNLEMTERELAKLKLILDSIADAVIVYSEKGIIQFANRPAENMFNYDTGELVGLGIRAVLELSPDELRSDFAATRTRREGVAVKEVRKVRGIAKSGLQFDTQMQVKLFESGKERLLVATLQSI